MLCPKTSPKRAGGEPAHSRCCVHQRRPEAHTPPPPHPTPPPVVSKCAARNATSKNDAEPGSKTPIYRRVRFFRGREGSCGNLGPGDVAGLMKGEGMSTLPRKKGGHDKPRCMGGEVMGCGGGGVALKSARKGCTRARVSRAHQMFRYTRAAKPSGRLVVFLGGEGGREKKRGRTRCGERAIIITIV